ncbi:MAG: DUF4085 family protein [Phycisphaerae bacterium]
MQFFTMGWWSGDYDQTAADAAVSGYQAHFEQIAAQLPAHVRAIDEHLSLHDGRIRSLRLNSAAATLEIDIDGFEQLSVPVRIELRYVGVTDFRCEWDEHPPLGGPGGFGDLGYSEMHLSGDRFEHRFLFSPGSSCGLYSPI